MVVAHNQWPSPPFFLEARMWAVAAAGQTELSLALKYFIIWPLGRSADDCAQSSRIALAPTLKPYEF